MGEPRDWPPPRLTRHAYRRLRQRIREDDAMADPYRFINNHWQYRRKVEGGSAERTVYDCEGILLVVDNTSNMIITIMPGDWSH